MINALDILIVVLSLISTAQFNMIMLIDDNVLAVSTTFHAKDFSLFACAFLLGVINEL